MYGISVYNELTGKTSFYPKNFDDGIDAEKEANALTRAANRAMNGLKFDVFAVYQDQ